MNNMETYQQRYTEAKRKPKILELKSTIIKIKISLEGLKGRFKQVEDKSVNLKSEKWKCLNLKNRKKKV